MASRLYVVAKIPKTVYDGRVKKKGFLKRIIVLFFFLSFLFALLPSYAFATISVIQDPPTIYRNTPMFTLTFTSDAGDFIAGQDYAFLAWPELGKFETFSNPRTPQWVNANTLKATYSLIGSFANPGNWQYRLWQGRTTYDYNSNSALIPDGKYYIYPCENLNSSGCPGVSVDQTTFQGGEDKSVSVYIINAQSGHTYNVFFENEKITYLNKKTLTGADIRPEPLKNFPGLPHALVGIPAGKPGTKRLCLNEGGSNCDFSYKDLITIQAPAVPTPAAFQEPLPNGQVGIPSGPVATPPFFNDVCPNKECNTAIGKISTDPAKFVQRIFSLVLGMAGGIALILIIISGYKFMVSQGNPEAVKGATEQVTSAIVGLLFIIFAFVILQIIGVDILRIPGFSK